MSKPLTIRAVYTKKDENGSRIVIDVGDEKVNLHEYAILDNTFNIEGTLSDIYPHYYRFPKGTMAAPHTIVRVYTGKGTDSPEGFVPKNSSTVHYSFYWNSDNAIWNDNDTAHLLHIHEIDNKKVTH